MCSTGSISPEEARLRNAVYTFTLVAEGVRRLLEQTTTGPLRHRGPFDGRRAAVPAEGVVSQAAAARPIARVGDGRGQRPSPRTSTNSSANVPIVWSSTGGTLVSIGCARVMRPATCPRITSVRSTPRGPRRSPRRSQVAQAWFAAENRRRPTSSRCCRTWSTRGSSSFASGWSRKFASTLRGNQFGVDAETGNPGFVLDDIAAAERIPPHGMDRRPP